MVSCRNHQCEECLQRDVLTYPRQATTTTYMPPVSVLRRDEGVSDCFQLPPKQGESAKSKEANSKDYNSAYKKGEEFKAKGQDYQGTGQHKYESAKASADNHTSSFYHSTQDKAHSAKDTVAHKAHDVHHNAKAQADDLDDDSLSKSEKAKEKVTPQPCILLVAHFPACHACLSPYHDGRCLFQCQDLMSNRMPMYFSTVAEFQQ